MAERSLDISVLITGGAGLIGSHLVELINAIYHGWYSRLSSTYSDRPQATGRYDAYSKLGARAPLLTYPAEHRAGECNMLIW